MLFDSGKPVQKISLEVSYTHTHTHKYADVTLGIYDLKYFAY